MWQLCLLLLLCMTARRSLCYRHLKISKKFGAYSRRYDRIVQGDNDDDLRRCVAAMGVISAPVGTLLDSTCHGMLDVLSYNAISIPIHIPYLLKTCIYTPVLFSVAGALMTYIVLVLDKKLNTRSKARIPGTSTVAISVVLFISHYFLSGLLDHYHIHAYYSNAILSTTALAAFLLTDRSYAGFALATTTAVGGTLIELFLVNQLKLYQYTNADFYGVASWIYAVYFCGGPAIGNLARSMYSRISRAVK